MRKKFSKKKNAKNILKIVKHSRKKRTKRYKNKKHSKRKNRKFGGPLEISTKEEDCNVGYDKSTKYFNTIKDFLKKGTIFDDEKTLTPQVVLAEFSNKGLPYGKNDFKIPKKNLCRTDAVYKNFKDVAEPDIYDIGHGIKMQYSSVDDSGKKINVATGPWLQGSKTINFYQCSQSCNGKEFITYRFGTYIQKHGGNGGFNENLKEDKTGSECLKNITLLTDKIRSFGDTRNKIIDVSLLNHTYTAAASIANSFLIRKKDPTEEKRILNCEQAISMCNPDCDLSTKTCSKCPENIAEYYTIHFPLYGGFFRMFTTRTKNPENKDMTNLTNLENTLDLSTDENTFISIIKFTLNYYYNFWNDGKDWVLIYHCKSGKDRTTTFDTVVQATVYGINIGLLNIFHYKEQDSMSQETIDKIRNIARYFFLFGLMINYYGGGIFGLKIQNVPLAKWIINNNDMYELICGFSPSDAT